MIKCRHIYAVIIAVSMCFSFLSACGGSSGDKDGKDGVDVQREYTIQYSDGAGVHSVTVKHGDLYSIDSLPVKNGHDFTGLFDAEIGGTQYVNANGGAVSVFTDDKNIVLYPQFKAKEYTLILDYGEAAVTGSRLLNVSYGSEISALPLNLTLENKEFTGWYTAPDRGGKQIADRYGVLPENRKVTEKVFDLSDPDGNIKLYAGFKNEEYTVTFYATENGAPEEVIVEYGTFLSDVQVETRVNGKAVIAWSKKRNDTNKEQIFDGKITGDIILYAAEYAPIIDFDTDGGDAVNSIIAKVGEAIDLPVPQKDNYKFIGWSDQAGNAVNYSSMPEESVKLYAKWQATIVFDTNGGTKVNNISEPQGTAIVLPTTEKAGFIFAGWFDGDRKVDMTVMPQNSVVLRAKYYKRTTDNITVIPASSEYSVSYDTKSPNMNYSRTVDLSYLYDAGITEINITAHYSSRTSMTGDNLSSVTSMAWYGTNTASAAYKIWGYDDSHRHTNSNNMYLHPDSYYEEYTRSKSLSLTSSSIYICFYGNDGFKYGKRYWKDFWLEIEYLDTSTLY